MDHFRVQSKHEGIVAKLEKQIAELEDEKKIVKRFTDAVASRGEGIESKFKNWLGRAEQLIQEAENLVGDAKENAKKKKHFFDPKYLYKLSKEIAELMEKARAFPVSFMEFKSRKDVMKDIMDALQKPSIKTVRVYGEQGVGKTMLVEEVKRQAEQEKLFDAVVMARETRNPDLKRIQHAIARDLGLELPDRITLRGAADRIKSSLANKKVLVILDDIWAGTDLKEVGIPVGNNQKQTKEDKNEQSSSVEEPMECMVLETARYPHFFPSEMHTHEDIEVCPLEDSEALELFEKIAGDQAKNHVLRPIAAEISKKCNGLPIAIATLASALKGKNPQQWRTTLRRLLHSQSGSDSEGKNSSVMLPSLYSAISLRYGDLKSKELKQTLLLCCLISKRKSIQNLLKYGIGLGLFPGANSIEAARKEAVASVNKLRDSSLLLDGDGIMHFDMRDPIREVAISIACKDHSVLSLRRDESLSTLDKKSWKKYKWIHINGATKLPDELKCPQLTFFHLANKNPDLKIQDNFFRGTGGLRVLGLNKMRLLTIPSSISHLINLHTLRLDQSKLGTDLGSIMGDLKNLQVLSLVGCDIKELPRETTKLTKLKLLDLSGCTYLKVIPSGVLSSLSKLEELYLGNSFDRWNQASLDELRRLDKLTALEVRIHDINMIPLGLFSTELKRYKIFIGDVWNYWDSSFENSSKTLKLKLDSSKRIDFSVRKLLRKTEELHLEEMKDVKNVVNELDDSGFQEMKYLRIKNAPEIQHMIINPVKPFPCKAFPILEVLFLHNLIKLEKIFHGQFEATSFSKLRIITVERCNQLKNFFSFTIGKQLLHLQAIRVKDCSKMVEIIDDNGEGDANDTEEATHDEFKFDELQFLRLQHLPEFNSFCHEVEKGKSSSCIFSKKVLFPDLRELQLSWINISRVWHKELSEKPCSMKNLTVLIVEGCDKLEHLFSFSIVRSLNKLRHLEIRECNALTEIIIKENAEEIDEDSFKELNFLQIEGLQKLIKFCSGNYCMKFPSLKHLAIDNCPELKGFMVSTDIPSDDQPLFNEKVTFPSLERMTISRLKNLKILWHNLFVDPFPKLNFLQMEDLPKLIGFCKVSDAIKFPLLKQLAIENCPELKGFLVESLSTDTNSGIQALFNEKVAFPKLERMIISHLKNFKMIWHKLSADSFCELKSLRVAYCEKLSTIFPSDNDMLRKFLKSLEKLEIIGCGSIKEVFDLGKLNITETHDGKDTQLRELYIQQLLGLENVWKNYPKGTFNQLESVTVANCHGLKHLFPYALATSLSQLKRLEILTSGVEEIIAMGEVNEDAMFVFDSLSCLMLHSLSRLRCFYPGKHTTQWPALQKFYFYPFRKEQDQPKFPVKQPIFSEKEVISQLKKLSLTADDIGMIREQNPDFTSKDLENIEVLRILRFKSSDEFPISFLPGLKKLNKLVMEFCHFKQLFPSDSKELQKIRRLKLNFLPNISDIWRHDSDIPQELEILKVWHCKQLIRLSTATASFQGLTTLDVWSCPEIKYLISFSTAKSLRQLISLSIRECRMMTEVVENEEHATQDEISFKELRYLRLVCLTRLTTFCSGNCTLKFPSLELVIVNQCPKLKIFCKGALETLMLQRVHLSERKDKWYWASDLNATIRKLHEEKVPYSGMEILELSEFPELIAKWHTYPQEYFSFRQLMSLEVCNVSNLTYLLTPSMAMDLVRLIQLDVKNCEMMEKIIKGGAEVVEENKLTFHQLKVITLESCSKLTSFSTGSYTLNFPSLINVSIADCRNMVIFASTFSSYQEQEASEPFFSKVEFPNLNFLKLSSVSKNVTTQEVQEGSILRSVVLPFEPFWNSRMVSKSLGFKSLLGYSVAKSMNHLSNMTIYDCSSLEEIIASEGDEEDDIVLRQFKYLQLKCLRRLASFCSGNCNFKFPSLHEVIVSECPKMHFFSKGVTETRTLKKVKLTENDDGSWKGDNLNSTIQYLFKNGRLAGPRNKTTFLLIVIGIIFILLLFVYFNFFSRRLDFSDTCFI